jgi:hypothetical protein
MRIAMLFLVLTCLRQLTAQTPDPESPKPSSSWPAQARPEQFQMNRDDVQMNSAPWFTPAMPPLMMQPRTASRICRVPLGGPQMPVFLAVLWLAPESLAEPGTSPPSPCWEHVA